MPRVDGRLKVTGQATYTADVDVLGCLWGAILRGPWPHARIARVDVSRARSLAGVRAVLTGADIGGALFGRAIADVPVLCTDRVRFIGDPVAAVAAVDRQTAEEALRLIEVGYEELPAVLDPFAATKPGAPLLHPDFASYRRDLRQPGWPDEPLPDIPNLCSYRLTVSGDLERGFREADVVFEHTYRTPAQHQGYIEPHSCIVSAEPDGTVRVWASTKSPFVLRGLLARDLELSPERIVVEPLYVGGDFGGKGSPMHVPLAYFLSRAAGQPVRIILSGVEDMQAGDPRHPAWVTIRTGLKRDGTIVARHVKATFAGGAYAGFKPIANAELAGGHYVHGVYRIPNHAYESQIVYTNTVPCGHMRAPGGLQTVFPCEVEMDRLARALGMGPFEFRLKNGVQPGDMGIEGQPWSSVRLRECLDAVRRASGWDEPKKPGMGRGLALCQSPIGPGASTARVVRDAGGEVTLQIAVFDQGSGAHTILAQIVANELGLPPEHIRVEVLSTDSGLWDRGSSASAVTHGAGQAALRAATELRQKIDAGAAGALSAEARYENWHPPSTTSFVAQVVEVEVDPETGQVHVCKVTGAYDVGTVLNATGVTGQIEGGLLMGLGAAAMEDLRIVDGLVEAAGLHEYKLPTICDVPEHELLLITDDAGPGPYGAKQTSELSNLPFAAAYANAVYDAVGVKIDHLPVKAEDVHVALRQRQLAPA
ncbi:MAG TPA: xanthine dehydrogenase family protein molybdopterin-binding subunit [Chloroflexota bacterium]|nr:xanthine dehydrogenase family protein molybdopterin-binding subunit [Chloroflexota bacterium]